MCTPGTLDNRIDCYANFEIAPERPAPLDAMIAEVDRPLKGGAGRSSATNPGTKPTFTDRTPCLRPTEWRSPGNGALLLDRLSVGSNATSMKQPELQSTRQIRTGLINGR
jgi:hypothetical protein